MRHAAVTPWNTMKKSAISAAGVLEEPGKRADGAREGGAPAAAPLYRQLVDTLRKEILDGIYLVGAQLPTEGELTERFGVSRHTVREALRRLRDDGLVSSRQGSGTTVVRPGTLPSYVHEVSSINDLIAYVTEVRYEVDSCVLLESDEELAAKLGGELGQRWLRICGFRYALGQAAPVCWTEVYVDAEYAGVARLVGRRQSPIYELIEDLYGERVSEVEQVLSARPVPAEIAPTLQIEPDAIVIEMRRIYRMASGKVAEIALNLHPSDRFRFAMTMRRAKG
jgi:DNA-binding GntR family transcriptional regulator